MYLPKLRELRKEQGYTQEYIARKYGNCSRKTYNQYERGEKDPPLYLVYKLSKVYNVSLDYLVSSDITDIIVETSESRKTHHI